MRMMAGRGWEEPGVDRDGSFYLSRKSRIKLMNEAEALRAAQLPSHLKTLLSETSRRAL